jgi:signal transduction histidine kinase
MKGGGELGLTTENCGTGWVRAGVRDSGVGIAAEHMNRIFEPFFTTKPPGTGTGLGLSVSYSIVERHGGRIEVTSKVGQGSEFSVLLPIQGKE